MSERPDPVAAVIDGHLQAEAVAGRITVIGPSARAWDVLVPSYFKEAVPVSLVLGDRFLRAEAFFLRSPEDRAGTPSAFCCEGTSTRPGGGSRSPTLATSRW